MPSFLVVLGKALLKNLSYNSLGITSTAICPGYTITNFHRASGVQNEIDRVPSFMK